jgi:hypothetical protein
MKVEISDQVLRFVMGQAPEVRRRLRLALRHLALERGDIRTLEGPLKGYCRLRVGTVRIVFVRAVQGGVVRVRCLYAERRDVVYAVFGEMLKERMLGGE